MELTAQDFLAPRMDAEEAATAPFGVQLFVATQVREQPHDVARIITRPSVAGRPLADTDVWVYEQLKRIVQDLNVPWIVRLQAECRQAAACDAMTIGEDVFVCTSHETEQQCSAFDYIVHALDAVADVLHSQRHFPANARIPKKSVCLFRVVCKSLARVFLHIIFQHAELFRECEAQTALYERFYALADAYELYPIEALPAPAEAGLTTVQE